MRQDELRSGGFRKEGRIVGFLAAHDSAMIVHMCQNERSFFDELLRRFLSRPQSGDWPSPLDGVYFRSRPDGIFLPFEDVSFRPCAYCSSYPLYRPTDGNEIYVFTFHFYNASVDQRFELDVGYWYESDVRGIAFVRHCVVSGACRPQAPVVASRSPSRLASDSWIDVISLFGRDELEKFLLVSRSLCKLVNASHGSLPLRRISSVTINTPASEDECTISLTLQLSSCYMEFTFVRTKAFSDLRDSVAPMLRNSWISAFILHGCVERLLSSGLLKSTVPIVINELRIPHSVSCSANALEEAITYCVQQRNVPNLQCLRVDLVPRILQLASIPYLTRLQLAVPADDCRQQMERFLVGNPRLDVGVQFLFGFGEDLLPLPQPDAPTLIWSAFTEAVFSNLRDGTYSTFVRSLWIRSTFEVLPTIFDGRRVDARVEDGDDAFEVYNIGTRERPFSVFRCVQRNYSGLSLRFLYYYFVEAGWHDAEVKRPHRNFSEWLLVDTMPELGPTDLYSHWHPPTSARMAAIRKLEEENS